MTRLAPCSDPQPKHPQDLQRAVDAALATVEAVDEPWLYRYAAQSLAEPTNTVTPRLR